MPWRTQEWVKAVDGVDFAIGSGETLGLVGESGCGKTTVTRLILLLERPTAGAILFNGRDVLELRGKDLLAYRQAVQCVFQDPYSSLSPRMRVREIIAEPLEVLGGLSRQQIRARVAEALELVGLKPLQAGFFPHEFSGGQRQRIAIARAIATSAKLIVLDEPVSALDVSIRAQIMVLLEDLQQRLGVSYLFIGHDLATVTHISHRIAVMYLGRIVEEGDSRQMCEKPLHPYTQALFAAALPALPNGNKDDHVPVTGEVPSALSLPTGCRFHPRCPSVMGRCREDEPELRTVDGGRSAACYLYEEAKMP
ncbi:MAG TPA: oligopeptide/dipeptide ABC transporter ATP-binding protein [Chloroflexota bacterium]|nr:oligopeptide/dipeptide ABC transporter ATP-binding protein [Chloroflexota bacterium]